ncbi:MAG: aspartate-semialdehyde dehydrogenase [Promethearchaeota archaeon]
MVNQKKAAILGLSNSIGQKFVKYLDNHPWIRINSIHDSSLAGKSFNEVIKGFHTYIFSEEISNMKIKDNKDIDLNDTDLIFSALPSAIGTKLELELAISKPVFTMSSELKIKEDIPVILPYVNISHYKIINNLRQKRGWNGFIIGVPSNTSVGIAFVISGILRKFGVKSAHVISMESVLSTKYPGIPSHDIIDNIIPFVPNKESLVINELSKILGHFDGEIFNKAEILIDLKCVRVPILEGITQIIFFETIKETNVDEINKYFENIKEENSSGISLLANENLPYFPKNPIICLRDLYRPQPRIDAITEPMSINIGGIQSAKFASNNNFKIQIVYHDLQIGLIKNAILTAEWLIKKELI